MLVMVLKYHGSTP